MTILGREGGGRKDVHRYASILIGSDREHGNTLLTATKAYHVYSILL